MFSGKPSRAEGKRKTDAANITTWLMSHVEWTLTLVLALTLFKMEVLVTKLATHTVSTIHSCLLC